MSTFSGQLQGAFPDLHLDEEKCEAEHLPEAFRTLVKAMHDANPRLTWNDVCGKVGAQFEHRYADEVVKYSPQTVIDYTRDLKWPDPRYNHTE